MTEPSQTEIWVVAAQRGDRLALTKLLTTYHPCLRARAAAQMGTVIKAKANPDDILQEAYLDVIRQIGRFKNRGPGSFLSWVYGIVDHKLVDARRAARCKARDIDREVAVGAATADSYWDLLDNLCTNSSTPSRVVRRQEALDALLVGLSDLSERHHQVIELRFLEGLSVAEVASRLDKSQDAVVALTKRALAALRKSMDDLGEFTRGS